MLYVCIRFSHSYFAKKENPFSLNPLKTMENRNALISVHPLTLVAELAHQRIYEMYLDDEPSMYVDDDFGGTKYTEECQVLYDKFYGEYWDIVMSCKVNN